MTNARNLFDLSIVIRRALGKMFTIFRILHQNDAILFVRCFKCYVLPYLDYCSSVWSPHKLGDIRNIEKVQRIFSRIVYGRCRLVDGRVSYRDRIKFLGLETLFERRIKQYLVLLHRILKQEVQMEVSKYFSFRPCGERGNTYNRNGFSFDIPRYSTMTNENAFFIRVAKWYPKLPPHLTCLSTSDAFRKLIRKENILDLLQLATHNFFCKNALESSLSHCQSFIMCQ